MTHLHGQRLDQNTMNQRCGPVPCVEMVEQLVLLTHSVLVGFGSGLITSKWNNNVGIAWHGSSFRSYDPDAPRLGAETLSPQSTHHGCVLESSFQDLFLLVAPIATQIQKTKSLLDVGARRFQHENYVVAAMFDAACLGHYQKSRCEPRYDAIFKIDQWYTSALCADMAQIRCMFWRMFTQPITIVDINVSNKQKPAPT